MNITRTESAVIKEICENCKNYYDIDLRNYSVDDLVDIIKSNFDDYWKCIKRHSFFEDTVFNDLNELWECSSTLLIYFTKEFLDDHIGKQNNITSVYDGDNFIEVNPETLEPISIEEDKENKKQFIKEVMEGVEKKKTLKDFLDDPRSYKQFRDNIEDILMYIDWGKIHETMKNLQWTWASWEDFEANEHYNSTPDEYGLKEEVLHRIHEMEEWINEHPDATEYRTGTGGWEYEMRVCDPEDENDPDDYNNRVRFIVRFVLEQCDNGI